MTIRELFFYCNAAHSVVGEVDLFGDEGYIQEKGLTEVYTRNGHIASFILGHVRSEGL
jgi:hypothetical protein